MSMKKKLKEEWRDIAGYEGLYKVSNTGKIRSCDHYARNNIYGAKRFITGKVLKCYKMPNGYLQVQLSKNEKREKRYIHRLVAETFLHNDGMLTDVNHIDGDKNNNFVSNLEWVSHKDNQIHMIKNRMTKKAFPVLCVETNKQYNSMSEAQNETGVDRHLIKKACNSGKAYSGLHWRWID